jgi:hypothetical protein
MFTRKQYLDRECNHREYYAQFVTPGVKQRVLQRFGIDALKASEEPSFNDLPLAVWDSLLVPVPSEIASKLRECGDYATLSGCVCILKEAARQLVEARSTRHVTLKTSTLKP